MKVLAVFTLILVSAHFLQTEAAEDECTLSPSERTDCGFGGIGRDICVSKGCCFDSSIPGVIWCYKNPKTLVPEVEDQGQEEKESHEQEDDQESQTSEEQEEKQEPEETPQEQEEPQTPEEEKQEPEETPQEQEEPQTPEEENQGPEETPQEQEEPQTLEEVC